ncbi:MAG TPA: glutaredoxin domain-containing protein [Actinomycetota bacterium]|nr:glutaredoxin domain-containing protein [Actinomycetota bacterium]
MIVFPAVAALVSAIFAVQLLSRYAQRKRLPQLAWGIAMTMYALASLAVAGGVSGGWDPTLFRIYYLFGALLNVPYLALGSVALIGKRALSALALSVVLVATAYAIVKVAGTSMVADALMTEQIPRGKDTWADQSVPRLASVYSISAYVVVLLVTFATSTRRTARRVGAERVRANRLIALGVTIVAVGSTALTRVGRGSAFSITLAVGVVVMYLGFRMAIRTPKRAGGRLILYTSENCGLCEYAREALDDLGLDYEELEVPDDHPYRLRTPVLESDGIVVTEGEITTPELRRRLGVAARPEM